MKENDKDIDNLINMNYRLLLLIGYASALLHDARNCCHQDKYDWFMKSVENLIYLDKPLPPCP